MKLIGALALALIIVPSVYTMNMKTEGKDFFTPFSFRTFKDNDVYSLAMALHQAKFYLRKTDRLKINEKLAIYRLKKTFQGNKHTIEMKGIKYAPTLVGRAIIVKKQRRGVLEAEVRSADCFDPMNGWQRKQRPSRRGPKYILSKNNYTDLPASNFKLLMSGEYWTGMSKAHFSAIAADPTTTVLDVTDEGQKTEEWTFEMPGKKWHYLFVDDVLKSYIE